MAGLAALVLAVAGCGGGGGGDGTPSPPPQPPPVDTTPPPPERPAKPVIEHDGRAEPAHIDATNATPWVGTARTMLQLPQALIDLLSANPFVNVDEATVETTLTGPEGGQAIMRGVLRSQGPTSTTGWVWTEFENYGADGWIVDGRVVQDIVGPITGVSHSIVLELTNLHLTRGGATTEYHGTVRDVLVNDLTGFRRTTSSDLRTRDLQTGKTIFADGLAAERVRTFTFHFDETYSGRIYDQVEGYVDVSSDSAQTFINDETRPDRGGALRLTGANGSAGLTPLNPEHAAVSLDEDGDGIDERFTRVSSAALTVSERAADSHSPAVANAGAERFVEVGKPVELNGLLSHDADGSFVSAAWALKAKPLASAAALDFAAAPLAPTFTPDVPGTYTFALRVHDPDGDAEDSVKIHAAANVSAIWGVRMRLDRPVASPLGLPVTLDAGTSRRQDASEMAPLDVLYSWRLDPPRGSSAALTSLTSPTPSFIPDLPGFYRITVENGIGSPSYYGRATKIVGFGTGFQFHEPAVTAIAGPLHNPVVADLDADGDLDLATLGFLEAKNHWAIRVFLGDGSGAFRDAAELPVQTPSNDLLHGDLDGDGLPELVVLAGDTLFVAYLGAPVSASHVHEIPLGRNEGCGHARLAIADSDGDGQADLLLADPCLRELVTWKHTNGELAVVSTQVIPELVGLPIAFGDLSGDGRVDFVVPREPPTPRHTLLVFVQQPSGEFAQASPIEALISSLFAIGDVTGDGRGDLVTIRGSQPPTVSVFAASGTGELLPGVDYVLDSVPSFAPRFADLDGDGRTDVVTNGDGNDLLLGLQQPNGKLAFLTLPDELPQSTDSVPAFGDVDGNGRIDVVRLRQAAGESGFSIRFGIP